MFHPDGPSFRELIEQALASTERGYDLLAPKFERTPFRTPEKVLELAAQVIGPTGDALDVCCGTGAALAHLRRLASGRVVGIDFSRGMLDEARRRVPGVELVYGDALALRFENAFDVVTCFGALGHITRDDEDRFVAGIARALRPGGRFVFATSRRPPPTSPWLWLAHGFNAAMRVRNALVRPAFIMYYLTFLWPEVEPLLVRHGFSCSVHERGRVVIVTASKSSKA